MTISPARFEGRVLRDGRISGRRVFESDPLTIAVEPIPAPPDEYRDAAWLPAREVEISEEWSREFDELTAGEPVSRNITVAALGQLETQIPATEPPETPGINVYPDRPALNRRVVADGIVGIRTDQYAMIGSQAGEVVLPAVELPWFDVDDEEWRVARLPEQTVTILPGADAAQPVEVVEPEADRTAQDGSRAARLLAADRYAAGRGMDPDAARLVVVVTAQARGTGTGPGPDTQVAGATAQGCAHSRGRGRLGRRPRSHARMGETRVAGLTATQHRRAGRARRRTGGGRTP